MTDILKAYPHLGANVEELIERLAGVVADYERGIGSNKYAGPMLAATARELVAEMRAMGLRPRVSFSG